METRFHFDEGYLDCKERGGRVELLVEVANKGQGLYKALLHGEGSARMELGTLIPERGYLVLRRSIAQSALQSAGCYPITGCSLRLVHAFGGTELSGAWQREGAPARLFAQNSELGQALAEQKGALLCRNRVGYYLALPFHTRQCFPLPSIFCFARLRKLGGGDYLVFSFDETNSPCMP